MKKFILRTLGVLAAVIVIILIIASTKPDTFRVERTMSMKAPPEKISAAIANFHQWNSWSPFEKLDPQMKKTFSGAAEGVGAVYEWEGNSDAGAGRMEIVEASVSKIKIKLDFLKPFEGHNTSEFILEPDGEITKVTWAMYGPNQYIGKVMSVFFSMDTMLGKEFETGLTSLKSNVEA
ncbi:MAG: SRPBCC family protein [Ignavibacteriales bacterium]|nr:SRPBCC family protein [Ignavibacteriales bacterium]